MQFNNFNAADVDPSVPREIIPAGWYKCVIAESEEKPTKAMTGSYLQMSLEVIDGAYQGRRLISRLNLNNPSPEATEIAHKELSAICRAVGVLTPRHSEELHDKPLMVKVSVKPADGNYEAQNEVKGFAAIGAAVATTPAGVVPVPAVGAKPSYAQAAAAGGSTPPWKRK
jgi:hypothetical protein